MELNTVNQIREKRDLIRERIKDLNLRDYGETNYGSENEYTFKTLISGIEALLTDISALTRYPSKFAKISTYNERSSIQSNLTGIETYLESPANYIPQFEALKIQLRSFNVRYFTDRQVEFENEIEEVREIKLQLQQVLVDSKKLKDAIVEASKNHTKALEKIYINNFCNCLGKWHGGRI